jgi:septal ring factor EnvC (AmiA/AmiB activator)
MQETIRVLAPIVVTHVAILAVILVVIRRLVLGDTLRAVAKIRQVEAEVRKKEESIRREIAEHEKEFEQKKQQSEEALQKQREQSEREVARLRDQTLAEAQKEGEKIVQQAKKNEERLRQQIAQDMEGKAVEYGGQIFKLVFSEEMNGELNRKFIGELLDALDEVDGASITVDPNDAEFRSSHPIEGGQKARLETLLKAKFGADVKVAEKVVPELLAGLAFKLGSLEIDGSLLSRYHEAVAEVKKNASV